MTALTSLFPIILRTSAIYLVILIGIRLSGKRELGQMTAFDLVVLLLIANGVQNAMVGGDTTLLGGIVAAATLLLLNWLLSKLSWRLPHVRRLLEGIPTVLVSQGVVVHANLQREGVDQETLAAAFREHGVATLDDVEMAVLEIDGSISVVPKSADGRHVKRIRKIVHHN
jgi:uncharacterized membrane protein YcaP (DUF421 family)